ncbi:GDSL-type esterase/lipase family protein [Nocardia brevicatena]|uniref:GDSL-type esterase/lipase family protein n=1 Tax=Nocardia brevicatena TaxID=37327 RepID=UPI000305059C|nr:GDSL-type esterase/lipase family protein [Nocardia brevicatena]
MTNPMLEKLVRFQRPEHTLPFAQSLSAPTLAGIFGAGESEYHEVLEGLGNRLNDAATRISLDPRVGSHLRHLPFEPGDRIVVIGESTTADRLSWFEILRTLLETRRPELRLGFANLSFPGATTTQMLARLSAIRRHRADWIFCMLGSNDSQRLSTPDGPLLVSREETLRNLAELRARAITDDSTHWIWVAPTPIEEARVNAFPFFRQSGITWTNSDLVELTAALRNMADPVVDSASAVDAAGADAFTEDGLHPGIAVHEALAVQVLHELVIGGAR